MTEKNLIGNEFPDYYVQSSETLLRKINPTVAIVFGKIWLLSKELGFCYIDKKELARQLGIDPDTFWDAVDILQGKETLSRSKKPNKYSIYINSDCPLVVDVTPKRNDYTGPIRFSPHVLNFQAFIQKYPDSRHDPYQLTEEQLEEIRQNILKMYQKEKIVKTEEKIVNLEEKIVDSKEKIVETEEKIVATGEKIPSKRVKNPPKETIETKKETTKQTTEETKKETKEVTTGPAGNESTSQNSNSQEVAKSKEDFLKIVEIKQQMTNLLSKKQTTTREKIKEDAVQAGLVVDFNNISTVRQAMELLNFIKDFGKKPLDLAAVGEKEEPERSDYQENICGTVYTVVVVNNQKFIKTENGLTDYECYKDQLENPEDESDMPF